MVCSNHNIPANTTGPVRRHPISTHLVHSGGQKPGWVGMPPIYTGQRETLHTEHNTQYNVRDVGTRLTRTRINPAGWG